jgi:peptide deformylase
MDIPKLYFYDVIKNMTLLSILRYPDPRLTKVAKPVREFNNRLQNLINDMAETMYNAPGIGLAATQVDVHERIIVIDISDTHDQLHVFMTRAAYLSRVFMIT